jgi:mono/diheme cytochrome c family protein
MIWNRTGICTLALTAACGVIAAAAHGPHDQAKPAAAPAGGWVLPADADAKKSPLTVDDKVLATGKTIFKNKCQKCHGPNGRGDGPDADPEHQEDMDLTASARASKNPEGVMFYKVANGRKKPKMPSFKDELTEQQIWSVVAYAKSLRK